MDNISTSSSRMKGQQGQRRGGGGEDEAALELVLSTISQRSIKWRIQLGLLNLYPATISTGSAGSPTGKEEEEEENGSFHSGQRGGQAGKEEKSKRKKEEVDYTKAVLDASAKAAAAASSGRVKRGEEEDLFSTTRSTLTPAMTTPMTTEEGVKKKNSVDQETNVAGDKQRQRRQTEERGATGIDPLQTGLLSLSDKDGDISSRVVTSTTDAASTTTATSSSTPAVDSTTPTTTAATSPTPTRVGSTSLSSSKTPPTPPTTISIVDRITQNNIQQIQNQRQTYTNLVSKHWTNNQTVQQILKEQKCHLDALVRHHGYQQHTNLGEEGGDLGGKKKQLLQQGDDDDENKKDTATTTAKLPVAATPATTTTTTRDTDVFVDPLSQIVNEMEAQTQRELLMDLEYRKERARRKRRQLQLQQEQLEEEQGEEEEEKRRGGNDDAYTLKETLSIIEKDLNRLQPDHHTYYHSRLRWKQHRKQEEVEDKRVAMLLLSREKEKMDDVGDTLSLPLPLEGRGNTTGQKEKDKERTDDNIYVIGDNDDDYNGNVSQSGNKVGTKDEVEEDQFRESQLERIELLTQILLIYAREHPELGYRQGMHEVLSYLFLAIEMDLFDEETSGATSATTGGGDGSGNGLVGGANRDIDQMGMGGKEDKNESISNEQKFGTGTNIVTTTLSSRSESVKLLDPDKLVNDAYTMFERVMASLEAAYDVRSSSSSSVSTSAPMSQTPSPNKKKTSPMEEMAVSIVLKLRDVAGDDTLYRHVSAMSVPPQLYCARWVRLMFSREVIGWANVLKLWDVFFELAWDKSAVGRGRSSTSLLSSSTALMDVLETAAAAMILLVRDKLLPPTPGRRGAGGAGGGRFDRRDDPDESINILMNYPPMHDATELSNTLYSMMRQARLRHGLPIPSGADEEGGKEGELLVPFSSPRGNLRGWIRQHTGGNANNAVSATLSGNGPNEPTRRRTSSGSRNSSTEIQGKDVIHGPGGETGNVPSTTGRRQPIIVTPLDQAEEKGGGGAVNTVMSRFNMRSIKGAIDTLERTCGTFAENVGREISIIGESVGGSAAPRNSYDERTHLTAERVDGTHRGGGGSIDPLGGLTAKSTTVRATPEGRRTRGGSSAGAVARRDVAQHVPPPVVPGKGSVKQPEQSTRFSRGGTPRDTSNFALATRLGTSVSVLMEYFNSQLENGLDETVAGRDIDEEGRRTKVNAKPTVPKEIWEAMADIDSVRKTLLLNAMALGDDGGH